MAVELKFFLFSSREFCRVECPDCDGGSPSPSPPGLFSNKLEETFVEFYSFFSFSDTTTPNRWSYHPNTFTPNHSRTHHSRTTRRQLPMPMLPMCKFPKKSSILVKFFNIPLSIGLVAVPALPQLLPMHQQQPAATAAATTKTLVNIEFRSIT